MIERSELLKHAGEMIIVWHDDMDCFIIGWFFACDEAYIHLKITSTKFETYESREVLIAAIDKVETYEMN